MRKVSRGLAVHAAVHVLVAGATQSPGEALDTQRWPDTDQPHEQTTEDDIDFHLAIAEASGNALFNQIVMSFVPLMRVAVPQAWGTRRTADEKTDILARHKRLAWAIANRNADEAEQAMAAHFDEAIGALLR